MRRIETVCLDAGGTLVWPNWTRVSAALAAEGVQIDPSALAAADPRVRRSFDEAHVIAATTDQRRGWSYFETILQTAGVAPSCCISVGNIADRPTLTKPVAAKT